MKTRSRPLAAGLGLALFTGSVMAAPIGGTEILLCLLAVCWIGFPMLLLVALVCQAVSSFVASLKRPLPPILAPDTDLMT